MCGGNEENLFEIEAVRRGPRDLDMSVVDGIECPAEQRDQNQLRSIFTELILTSLAGLSCELRGTLEIFSTTS
jgi:hypothetical protein